MAGGRRTRQAAPVRCVLRLWANLAVTGRDASGNYRLWSLVVYGDGGRCAGGQRGDRRLTRRRASNSGSFWISRTFTAAALCREVYRQRGIQPRLPDLDRPLGSAFDAWACATSPADWTSPATSASRSSTPPTLYGRHPRIQYGGHRRISPRSTYLTYWSHWTYFSVKTVAGSPSNWTTRTEARPKPSAMN